MSKCPPGVICFENFTFMFVIIALLVCIYFIYVKQIYKINNNNNNPSHNPNMSDNYISDYNRPVGSSNNQNLGSLFGIFPRPSYSFTNVQNDVLMNPYAPPLKDERVIMSHDVRGGIPININTRAVDTNYRQIGLLKRMNGPEMLLPLLGRPLYVGRDKWQYYTMNDSNNQLKLPVSFKSKSCTSEYGCDEISNGDTVYVDGINATFQATIYDNAIMRYLPFV